jgi:hypothetical protein
VSRNRPRTPRTPRHHEINFMAKSSIPLKWNSWKHNLVMDKNLVLFRGVKLSDRDFNPWLCPGLRFNVEIKMAIAFKPN